MSQVRLSIGGKGYTIACADGQEDHVAQLGALVDAKLSSLGTARAPQEAQNLLFAALLIAEDLHQSREKQADQAGELERVADRLAGAERERALAAGQHDQQVSRIAELERELADTQSAARAAAAEGDEIRAQLTALRSDLADAEQLEAELRAGLAGLAEERDALQLELDEARMARSEQPAEEARGPAADPDLAPALERFADLLEMCAGKLEGRRASS